MMGRMMGLTPRQFELLEFIRTRFATTGRSPLIYEMMDHQGTRSISSIQRRLKALKDRGLIWRSADGWEVCK